MPELLIADALKALQENRQLLVPGGAIYTEAAGAGVGVSDDHLALINEWTRNPVNREQVYTFPALAIDEQTTRNYVRYTAASQRASVARWVGIPFLFNEDSQWASLFDGSDHSLKASSQMGRIYKADLVKTPQGFIGTLVHVYTVKGVDEKIDSFIGRLDSGLLKEVSIHVMVPEGAKCSICKQMYPCKEGHEIAQDYDGKTCFVETVGAFVPLELSSVACPGSVAAHVMADEDASNYKVIALREALGGSRSLLERNMDHKAESCTEAACKEDACKERLAKAHTESCTDEKCEEALCKEKRSQHSTEKCENKECKEEACVEKRKAAADPPEDEKERLRRENAAKKPALFSESDCPACGRGPASSTENAPTSFEEAIAPIRTDFQERVTQIVTAAESKVAAAVTERDACKERADQFDAMLADYVETTAQLAVERGTKEASEVDAYREELTKLGYAGVKAVREALKAAPAVTREVKTERLIERAADRFKRLGSTTQVTSENGQVKTYARPRLG